MVTIKKTTQKTNVETRSVEEFTELTSSFTTKTTADVWTFFTITDAQPEPGRKASAVTFIPEELIVHVRDRVFAGATLLGPTIKKDGTPGKNTHSMHFFSLDTTETWASQIPAWTRATIAECLP